MENFNLILPEIFISLSIMFLLILGVFKKNSASVIHYLSISYDNDPIKRYCQTEYKDNWKEKYYNITGKTPDNHLGM